MPIPPANPNDPPQPRPVAPAPAPANPAPSEPHEPERFQPAALIAAFIFPGLGHYLLGYTRRAAFIAASILGLFTTGLLIGGIDVVDRQENPVWFAGQAIVGPIAFGVDWIHQNHLKVIDPRTRRPRSPLPDEGRNPDGSPRPLNPGEQPPYAKSLGKVNDIGTLFAAVAGMLNLIVITDASFRTRRRKEDPRP